MGTPFESQSNCFVPKPKFIFAFWYDTIKLASNHGTNDPTTHDFAQRPVGVWREKGKPIFVDTVRKFNNQ